MIILFLLHVFMFLCSSFVVQGEVETMQESHREQQKPLEIPSFFV